MTHTSRQRDRHGGTKELLLWPIAQLVVPDGIEYLAIREQARRDVGKRSGIHAYKAARLSASEMAFELASEVSDAHWVRQRC